MKLRVACCTALVAVVASSPVWANANKVTICHVPPGNPANSHAINVSENAVQAHLSHGDFLGECCPCWAVSELQSVTAENQLNPGVESCAGTATDAVLQNIPGSTPGEEGGFAADLFGDSGACFTRDQPSGLPITAAQVQNCVQQIRNRCEAIGTPIP